MLAGGRELSVFHTLDLKSALALAVALERAPMGILMLHDHLTGHLYPALGHGMTSTECASIGVHRPGVGPLGVAFAEGHPVTAEADDDLDEELRQLMVAHRCARLSALPLASESSGPLGLLVLLHRRQRLAPAGPMMLLYANVLANALENMYLREVAEHARERAEVRSRAKTQFFARISHELRTPVQSVIGYMDLMRLDPSDPLPARHKDLLARATRSGEAILDVIDDLINFSRVEVGRVDCHLCRVSVAEAMEAAEQVVAPLAAGRRVDLRVERPKKEFVRADAGKLRQILVNLLANAVKFTPSGGSVTLSASREKRAKWVTFNCTDTGPGIATEKLGQIFEPFVQLGMPALDGLGGSGLGLPISREFAAAMGGELQASSDGHGSTFTLRLQRDRLKRAVRSRKPSRDEVTTRPIELPGAVSALQP